MSFTSADVALALHLKATTSAKSSARRICHEVRGSCTLGPSAAHHLVASVDDALRRYRGALLASSNASIVRSLERFFWLFHDALKLRVDMDTDCSCSWEARIDDAEALTKFLKATARAYWSTGANADWMVRLIETLACNVTDVAERHGIPPRFAHDDLSVEAGADRLAVCLFDMANDLSCGSWGRVSSSSDKLGG